jgi:hypothetical protein
MHPRNLAVEAALVDEELALAVPELELGALVADPHAASSAVALRAATILSGARTDTS